MPRIVALGGDCSGVYVTCTVDRFPLEPSRETLASWLDAASSFVLDHIDGLAQAPAAGLHGEEGLAIANAVSTPIGDAPLEGSMPAALAKLGQAAEASLNTAGPGYFAYIPGGGIPAAALADLVANMLNRFVGLYGAAPALARLEADVLQWLAGEFGYGPNARGLFTSGGSLANFTAVVTARERQLGEGFDLRQARAYTSSQAHHSVTKCLRMAGFPRQSARSVAVDSAFRLDLASLRRAVAADRKDGREPFLVIAASGTTNTGAIDPLDELADFCRQEGLWLHIDGAYGGAFILCPEGKKRLHGIGRADSITFDPHKGMFLPYGTGCLLVRDGADLVRAHQGEAAYLRDLDATEDQLQTSSADMGPELSRDFRGLRLWLPLMLHGAAAFRDALAEKLELTADIHQKLVQMQQRGAPIELVAAPQLSLLAFRLRRVPGEPLAAYNLRNTNLLTAINARKRIWISSTNLPVDDGMACSLRVCVLSFRTHQAHADYLIEDLVAALDEVTGGSKQPTG